MVTRGLSNKITAQVGEYLVCAQLGKLGYIATSFTGNVPEFDIIVTDGNLNSIPIQVKSSNSEKWPTRADNWLNININRETKSQEDFGDKEITYKDLIYVCVSISDIIFLNSKDRFFILTKADLQSVCTKNYRSYMDSHNWKRPRNYESLDNRYSIDEIKDFENNWDLIINSLSSKNL